MLKQNFPWNPNCWETWTLDHNMKITGWRYNSKICVKWSSLSTSVWEARMVSLRIDVQVFFFFLTFNHIKGGKYPISFRHGCAKDFPQRTALLRIGKPLFTSPRWLCFLNTGAWLRGRKELQRAIKSWGMCVCVHVCLSIQVYWLSYHD